MKNKGKEACLSNDQNLKKLEKMIRFSDTIKKKEHDFLKRFKPFDASLKYITVNISFLFDCRELSINRVMP